MADETVLSKIFSRFDSISAIPVVCEPLFPSKLFVVGKFILLPDPEVPDPESELIVDPVFEEEPVEVSEPNSVVLNALSVDKLNARSVLGTVKYAAL